MTNAVQEVPKSYQAWELRYRQQQEQKTKDACTMQRSSQLQKEDAKACSQTSQDTSSGIRNDQHCPESERSSNQHSMSCSSKSLPRSFSEQDTASSQQHSEEQSQPKHSMSECEGAPYHTEQSQPARTSREQDAASNGGSAAEQDSSEEPTQSRLANHSLPCSEPASYALLKLLAQGRCVYEALMLPLAYSAEDRSDSLFMQCAFAMECHKVGILMEGTFCKKL